MSGISSATAPPSQERRWSDTPILLLGLALLWQGLYWGIGDIAFRSPLTTIWLTADLVVSPFFWPHLAETVRAFVIALALALTIGIGLGLALGVNRLSRDVFAPVLVASYAVPKLTLYPIVLLMFGLGLPAKIAFGVIHGFIPIALFTMAAVRQTPRVLLKTGQVFRLNPWTLAWRVLLPAALPEIFAGLRIGFSLTLIGTLLGEMFAAQRGLGFLLMNAIGLHNVDLIMALTFLLILFAGMASVLLLWVNGRLRAGG